MVPKLKVAMAEEDKTLNMLFRISIICCTGIAIATIYDKDSIASILFYASFFVNVLLFVFCIQDKELTKNLKFIVRLFLVIAACGIASIVKFDITFSYIKKYIIYITVLSCYFISVVMIPSKKTIVTILSCNFLLAIMYIFRSQTPGAYVGTTLFMYFSNPNFAGIWLSITAILLAVTTVFLEKKLLKIITILLALYVMYLCYLTGARNILLSAFYAMLLLLYCIISKRKRFAKSAIVVIDFLPLIFAIMYLIVIKYSWINKWSAKFLLHEGKVLDSRYIIWLRGIDTIKEYLIFGGYRKVGSMVSMFQFHNTHIDVWASYGTVGFVLFILYMYKIIEQVNANSNGMKSMLALSGFIIMLLTGTGEAGLYANGMGMYIYVASFILLSKYFAQKDKEPSKKEAEE